MIIDNWVKAKSYSAWNMSLFGLPKLTIVCGQCSRQSKVQMQVAKDRTVYGWCAHCGICNRTGLVLE